MVKYETTPRAQRALEPLLQRTPSFNILLSDKRYSRMQHYIEIALFIYSRKLTSHRSQVVAWDKGLSNSIGLALPMANN